MFASPQKNSEIMYQFYVIYKDNSQIEGEVSSRDIFIQRFINPCVDDIDTYQIWKEEEEDFDDSSDCSSIFDGTPDWIRMMD